MGSVNSRMFSHLSATVRTAKRPSESKAKWDHWLNLLLCFGGSAPTKKGQKSYRIVCGFGKPLKSPHTRPNRRKCVHFPILRSNLLRLWLLCMPYARIAGPCVGQPYNFSYRCPLAVRRSRNYFCKHKLLTTRRLWLIVQSLRDQM